MIDLELSGRLGDLQLSIQAELPSTGITGIFGPSGSGKTTLLRCIAGFESIDGRIARDDHILQNSAAKQFIQPHLRQIGFVFQELRLFSHLSVKGNLEIASKFADADGTRSRTSLSVAEIIDRLNLGSLEKRSVNDLSGGEAQRVALGRALASAPRLLLLDEPMSALDLATRAELLPYLSNVCADLDIPALIVSHSIDEIAALADTLLVVERGQAVACGPTPTVMEHPSMDRLLEPAERGSRIVTRVTDYDPAYQLLGVELTPGGHRLVIPTEVPLETDAPAVVYIHARDVSIATQPVTGLSVRNALAATIQSIDTQAQQKPNPNEASRSSPYAEVMLDLDGQVLRTHLTRAAVDELGLTPGQSVLALIKAASFDR